MGKSGADHRRHKQIAAAVLHAVARSGNDPRCIVESVEGRKLFCSIHLPTADVFDPTGQYLTDGLLPTYTARVNFGPTNTRGVVGYSHDSGDVFSAKADGLEFGWTTGETTDGKVRKSRRSEDDRYDSFLTTTPGQTWELSVPNGNYAVRIAAGDAATAKGDYAYSIEGLSTIDGSASKKQRWLESTVTVAVRDGRLTLTSDGAGKLNFVDVVAVDDAQLSNPTPPPTKIDRSGRADGDPIGITGLTLVNAITDNDLQLLAEGGSFDLFETGSSLNVRANPFGDVQSVKFDLDSGVHTLVENVAPYALFGDANGDYLGQALSVGEHTLVVTPYGGIDASGTIGEAITVHFTVTDTTPTPPPPPPVSPPPPAATKFNFQPAAVPTVEGYLVDSGSLYGVQGAETYGWTVSHTDTVVDRDVVADQVLDTSVAVKQGGKWELAVPNGVYTVKVGAGDAAVSTRNNVWVEGVSLFYYQNQAAGQFDAKSLNVNVTDGRLTVAIGSSAGGLVRMNYVEVTPGAVTPPPTPPPPTPPPPTPPPPPSGDSVKVNFQPSTSPTVEGYLVDAGDTYGDRSGQAYGWTTSHADSVIDRDAIANQLLDTNVVVKQAGKWELGVPNGSYLVKVSVGDAVVASTNNVWVEGVSLFKNQPVAAGTFADKSLTVTVTDGRLTIGTGSIAGGLVRLNYLEVTPENVTPPPPPPPPPPPSSPNGLPTSIHWQTVTPNPVTRAEGLGTVVDGKLYVIGGLNGKVAGTKDGWIAIKRGDVYNPETNKWTRIADMPEAITHTSSVVVGKTIWFVGGYVGNHPGPGTTKVYKYDTEHNSWSRGPDLPKSRGAGGAALIGNTLFFVGGMDRERVNDKGDMWSLNLSNQSQGWVSKKAMPTARNHLSVVSNSGSLYTISGQLQQEERQVALKTVEVYNPSTNTWSNGKSIPVARSHVTSAVFNYEGRIVIIGGETGFNLVQEEVYMFDPEANQWAEVGELPGSRSTTVSNALPDGRIIVSTGNSPAGTATTWIGTFEYDDS